VAERTVAEPVWRLDDDAMAAVRSVISAATQADGVSPMSEQAMLRLSEPESVEHFIVERDGVLVGYAQLDPETASAELVVHPDRRRLGAGRALVKTLVEATGRPPLRIWAHGDLAAAAGLAASAGFSRARSLWQMARPLTEVPPEPRIPSGVVVDTFVPGLDDEEWVGLNARAFADHPEQGRLTLADLQQRMAQPWFDAAGFFVARRAVGMVGFHWTKVHDDMVGEVYVLGVDPAEQRTGLGRALTLVGLHHLREMGLESVMLYVESDNHAAVGLYTTLGFTRAAVDVMYSAGS
jgi:mycothiol synthase